MLRRCVWRLLENFAGHGIDRMWKVRFLPSSLQKVVRHLLKKEKICDLRIVPAGYMDETGHKLRGNEVRLVGVEGREQEGKILYVVAPPSVFEAIEKEMEKRRKREIVGSHVCAAYIPAVDGEGISVDKIPQHLRSSIESFLKRHPDCSVVALYRGTLLRGVDACWVVGDEVHRTEWVVVAGSVKLKQDLRLDIYPNALRGRKVHFIVLDGVGSSVAIVHRIERDGRIVREIKRLYVAVPTPLSLRLKLLWGSYISHLLRWLKFRLGAGRARREGRGATCQNLRRFGLVDRARGQANRGN